MLLASSWGRPGRLLSITQCTGRPHHNEFSTQSVNGVEAEADTSGVETEEPCPEETKHVMEKMRVWSTNLNTGTTHGTWRRGTTESNTVK